MGFSINKIIAMAALVFLCGCALTPEEASRMSMYSLCEKMLTSNNSTTREVAYNTLVHDGTLDACRADADNIMRAHEASKAAWSNFSNQLQTLSNQVDQQQQRQPQTFCNTYGNGPYGTVHCWQQ